MKKYACRAPPKCGKNEESKEILLLPNLCLVSRDEDDEDEDDQAVVNLADTSSEDTDSTCSTFIFVTNIFSFELSRLKNFGASICQIGFSIQVQHHPECVTVQCNTYLRDFPSFSFSL